MEPPVDSPAVDPSAEQSPPQDSPTPQGPLDGAPATYLPATEAADGGPPQPDDGPPQPDDGPPQPDDGPPQPDDGPPQPDDGPPQPDDGPPQPDDGPPHPEEMPRVKVTRRRAIAFTIFVLSVVGFLYFVLPRISGPNGLKHTVDRIRSGNPWWIAAGVAFECLSFAGYIALFRVVFVRNYGRIRWKESYQITMAGLAAARIFAAAGAGGVALTAWALRRSGMEPRVVACRMVAFLVLLYSIYAFSMVIDGVGLGSGLFPGGGSFAITLIPAAIGVILLGAAGAIALTPHDAERSLKGWAARSGPHAKVVARAVTVPATAASGVRTAIALVRTRNPYLLGAPAWWGFDICVLWASFNAFGTPPPFTVIWMAYFVGLLGNLLPLPGGVGGVDGGLIAAFVAFGVPLNLAVVAVLTYRAIAFWLPTIPGLIAYFQLRHTVNRWQGEIAQEHAARADVLEAASPARA